MSFSGLAASSTVNRTPKIGSAEYTCTDIACTELITCCTDYNSLLYCFHPQCISQASWNHALRGCVSGRHTFASLQRAAAVPDTETCYEDQ